MAPKLTEWFGPEVKPTIPGVYQTDVDEDVQMYQEWNGARWGCYNQDANGAKADGHHPSGHQNVKWRGLAEKPE